MSIEIQEKVENLQSEALEIVLSFIREYKEIDLIKRSCSHFHFCMGSSQSLFFDGESVDYHLYSYKFILREKIYDEKVISKGTIEDLDYFYKDEESADEFKQFAELAGIIDGFFISFEKFSNENHQLFYFLFGDDATQVEISLDDETITYSKYRM